MKREEFKPGQLIRHPAYCNLFGLVVAVTEFRQLFIYWPDKNEMRNYIIVDDHDELSFTGRIEVV